MTGSSPEKRAEAEGLAVAPAANWKQSKWLALVEFAIVGLIFLADDRHLIPFSKTPLLLLFGWASLRLRGLRWRDVGITRYRSWLVTAVVGVAAGAVLETFQLLVTQPALASLLHKQPDLSDFRVLTGNLKLTLLGIALSWTLAAFGEEMVYRGYLMNRVADVGGRTQRSWWLSLLVGNIVFGLAHAYQGPTGIIEEGIAGALLGVMYLRTGRNLWVPIIAHGTSDTIDAILIFLGRFPGM
ncbi:MAG TPA: type II CAAX endopeptidase family protein [Terriglobales bacterium]|nr:type II CAAX endopeptidase family protein [Terriglobales bacterium]